MTLGCMTATQVLCSVTQNTFTTDPSCPHSTYFSFSRAASPEHPTMTEYWVSQARHWCEFCRIWTAGNKSSIAFHESGKKHKEAVELSLREMRKRGRERKVEQNELERELAKIERSAMRDYIQHDRAGKPLHTAAASGAGMSDHRASRLAQLEAQISSDRLKRATSAAAAGAELPSGWRAETNPDGKVFYLHDETGAVQWEPPGARVQGGASDAVPASSSSQGDGAVEHGGWQQGFNEEGIPYYYHVARGITQWEAPAEISEPSDPRSEPMPTQEDEADNPRGSGTDVPLLEDQPGCGEQQASAPASADDDGEASAAAHTVDESGSASAPRSHVEDGSHPAVVDSTGLGAWTVVEEGTASGDAHGDGQPRDKRARVAWGDKKVETDDEEEAAALEEINASLPIPEEVAAAAARHAAAQAKADADAAADAPAPVFAKRKLGANKGGFRKKS